MNEEIRKTQISTWLNQTTSRMLTTMAGKLQRRKTMTTQRSMLASPSSLASDLATDTNYKYEFN